MKRISLVYVVPIFNSSPAPAQLRWQESASSFGTQSMVNFTSMISTSHALSLIDVDFFRDFAYLVPRIQNLMVWNPGQQKVRLITAPGSDPGLLFEHHGLIEKRSTSGLKLSGFNHTSITGLTRYTVLANFTFKLDGVSKNVKPK